MKKLVLFFLTFIFSLSSVSAQKAELMVRSGDKGLYLEHKVVAKESFYSVGRRYNVHPRFLASFNKLDMNKGLLIDQKLRIPLTDTNFTQQGNNGVPVYYKAGDQEDLAKISSNNKSVSLDNLRQWNNLKDDKVKEDTKIIIGFLLSKEMSALAAANKPAKEESAVKTDEKPVVTAPVVVEEKKPEEKKPEEKKSEEKKSVEKKPAIKEEIKKPEPVVVKNTSNPDPFDQGYFKSHFEQQIKTSPVSKEATVTAGIFKTTNGWQDAKYYLLIDAVEPGTIVKIMNPINNRIIYAKVLGEMSGIRQNEGLSIRISSAAAAILQITEQDKFIVKVNY